MYYDRDGNPLTLERWAVLFEDTDYKRVALTEVFDGIEVSTIWLGIDHNFTRQGPPIIFETMVFVALDEPRQLEMFNMVIYRESVDSHCYRWATEEQAIAGHEQVVAELREVTELADHSSS